MKYARRIDANHNDLVAELRQRGVKCWDFSHAADGMTDILTWYQGLVVMIEIKYGKNAVIKKSQCRFLSEWPGFCGIALTAEDAYKLATDPKRYGLRYKQKEFLAGVYLRMKGKHTRLMPVLKALEENL